MRKIVALALVLALAVGVAALLAPTDSIAKGKGGHEPPPCECAPTVGPCVLEECGFDCVYVCPFP